MKRGGIRPGQYQQHATDRWTPYGAIVIVLLIVSVGVPDSCILVALDRIRHNYIYSTSDITLAGHSTIFICRAKQRMERAYSQYSAC